MLRKNEETKKKKNFFFSPVCLFKKNSPFVLFSTKDNLSFYEKKSIQIF